jgi:hypothetical protein
MCFAELCDLSTQTGCSSGEEQRMFRSWLKREAIGRPLAPFGGSSGQLRFLRDHVDGNEWPRSATCCGA